MTSIPTSPQHWLPARPHSPCASHPGALIKGPYVRSSYVRSAQKALVLVQMYGNFFTSCKTELDTHPASDSLCKSPPQTVLIGSLDPLCRSPQHLPLLSVSCNLRHNSVYSSLPASPHQGLVFVHGYIPKHRAERPARSRRSTNTCSVSASATLILCSQFCFRNCK